MLFEKKKGVSRFVDSLKNSLSGFFNALLTESSFRQLFVLSGALLVIALCIDVTKVERLFLIASCFLLLVVELINTAIESTVDRVSLDIHPLSKRAKDIGGAAQLVTVLMALTIWAVVLL
nr:diacylglycerol kinase [uncultured Erwinia sp.]